MAVELFEVVGSRDTDGAKSKSNIVFHYYATGTDDESEVRAALEAEGANGYNYDGVIFPRSRYTATQEGPLLWRCTIEYSHPEYPGQKEPPETNTSTVSFDTTGGTFKITEALYQTNWGPGGMNTAPQVGKTIGVTDDKVEGVEIVIPQLQFSETHYKPANPYILQYIKNVSICTGRTNDRPFRGFAMGELLFLGAQGQLRTQGDWEITYNFSASSNIFQAWQIGDITVGGKSGHDYLWVLYEKVEDDADFVIPKPLGVYVAMTYYTADFASILGI